MTVEESARDLLVTTKRSVETPVNAPENHLQGNPALPPDLYQAPVKRRNKQILASFSNEMFFDFGEIVKVVSQAQGKAVKVFP